jgi:hypothetical protein
MSLTQGSVVIAKRKKRKKVRTMKNKLLLLAVAVLGTPLLAHVVNIPTAPSGLCSSRGAAVTVINILLSLIGQGPIC